MLLSAVELENQAQRKEQVLIVGAGAVGLAMAVDLARRGKSVTVLEAGPDMVSSESQKYFESARSVSRDLLGLHLGRFRTLGGTTNFWGGQLVPFDSIVFGARDWIGENAQWPISREDLEPFYVRALELIGMSKALAPDEEIKRRLGVDAPALPESLSFFFTRWLPEPNFKSLFRREIESYRNLRVITSAPVVALVRGEGPKSVAAAEVIDANGRRLVFPSDVIVLANGTIEIARLMSLSFSDGKPTPWSENAWLGRGFMDHLDIVAGEIKPVNSRRFHNLFDNAILDGIKYQPKLKLAEETQRQAKLLGIACHLIFNSSLADDLANAKLLIRGFLKGRLNGSILDVPRRLATLVTVGLPMVLRYLRHRRIYSPADLGIQLRLTSEQRLVAKSGIRLRPELDALGMPLIEIDWRVDGRELETMARFSEIVRDYLVSANLAEITLDARIVARDPSILANLDDANHHMGMARMARDASRGVVDENLRVFGSSNLYVAGSAVYPSTGFANPTFTAIALGLRLGAFIERGLRP